MGTETYRLYTYDVWGNADDGYEVNDVFRQSDTVELDPSWPDAQIWEALGHAGIWDGYKTTLEIDSISGKDTLYIVDLADGKPVAELRRESV